MHTYQSFSFGMAENLTYGPALDLSGAIKIGTVGSITAIPNSEIKKHRRRRNHHSLLHTHEIIWAATQL